MIDMEYVIFVFLFGLIVGSFLNVVIFRMGTGMGIGGRSQCFSCGHTLRWYELIPVMSYLRQFGKCSQCKSRISVQYVCVELCTAFLFVMSFFRDWSGVLNTVSIFRIVSLWIIMATLVVVFVYDLRHKIIPLRASIVFAGSALVYMITFAMSDVGRLYSSLYGVLALTGFLGFLWLISRGRWMGFGDVEFAVGMGIFLGFSVGISALALSFWIGAGYAVITMLVQKSEMGTSSLSGVGEKITMKSEVPFAPFLIMGTILAWYFRIELFPIAIIFS